MHVEVPRHVADNPWEACSTAFSPGHSVRRMLLVGMLPELLRG